MKVSEYVTGIQHIGIPTNDIERTIEFYTSLGFEITLRTVNPASEEPVCFLQLKDTVIETYQNGHAVQESGAIDHVALDVTDADKAFSVIKAGGYTLLDQEVQSLPFWDNGIKYFNILGPNGEKVEFSQIL